MDWLSPSKLEQHTWSYFTLFHSISPIIYLFYYFPTPSTLLHFPYLSNFSKRLNLLHAYE